MSTVPTAAAAWRIRCLSETDIAGVRANPVEQTEPLWMSPGACGDWQRHPVRGESYRSAMAVRG
jgi:hypothetical protein